MLGLNSRDFFFQAEGGIRDVRTWLEFRRVLFRSQWSWLTGVPSSAWYIICFCSLCSSTNLNTYGKSSLCVVDITTWHDCWSKIAAERNKLLCKRLSTRSMEGKWHFGSNQLILTVTMADLFAPLDALTHSVTICPLPFLFGSPSVGNVPTEQNHSWLQHCS